MLISNISFFIDCIKSLKKNYQQGNEKQRKQLATFIKTWIWYNSASIKVFWTGKTTGNGKVKEHWFSNLTTARQILENGFDTTDRKSQILWVFKRMQWNYTSAKENRDLIREQDYEVFLKEHKGNPEAAYKAIGLNLHTEEKRPGSVLITEFLSKKRSDKSVIVEIGFDDGVRHDFLKVIAAIGQTRGDRLEILRITNTNLLVAAKSFSELFVALMIATLGIMKKDEIKSFLESIGYDEKSDRGPYRFVNNYRTQTHRVFSVKTKAGEVFMTTYNNNSYKFSLLNRLGQFMQINFIFFDHLFNEMIEEEEKI